MALPKNASQTDKTCPQEIHPQIDPRAFSLRTYLSPSPSAYARSANLPERLPSAWVTAIGTMDLVKFEEL